MEKFDFFKSALDELKFVQASAQQFVKTGRVLTLSEYEKIQNAVGYKRVDSEEKLVDIPANNIASNTVVVTESTNKRSVGRRVVNEAFIGFDGYMVKVPAVWTFDTKDYNIDFVHSQQYLVDPLSSVIINYDQPTVYYTFVHFMIFDRKTMVGDSSFGGANFGVSISYFNSPQTIVQRNKGFISFPVSSYFGRSFCSSLVGDDVVQCNKRAETLYQTVEDLSINKKFGKLAPDIPPSPSI